MKLLPNILIVDDIEENLFYLETITKKIKVNLIEALSGTDALEKTRGMELALAIIDVQMPGMNGYDLALKLNEERWGNKVPVIFLTANEFDETEEFKGYISGAVDYLIKPVNSYILLSKIGVFLELYDHKQAIIRHAGLIKKGNDELKRLNDSLRKSEEKYRSYIDNAPDGVFVIDETGKYLEVNDAACRICGYSKEELLSMSVSHILCEESFAVGLPHFQELLESGAAKAELLFRHKNGSTRCWIIEAVKLTGKGFLCFTTDITERRQTEEKLFEEQLFTKALLDSIPGIFYLYTFPELHMVTWNKQHETLFGFKAEEMLGRHVLEWHVAETRDEVLKSLESFLESGVATVEALLLTKEGKTIPFLLSAVRFESNGQNYLIGVGTDITERKQAAQALLKSEATLTKAQQIAHLGNWELDNVTNDLHWSDETFRIFGYAPQEVFPALELFFERVHPADLYLVKHAFAEAWKSCSPYSIDHRIVLSGGEERMVHEQAEIMYDESGNPRKWMGIVQDITESNKAERELKSSLEQLQKLSQYIEQVRENERVAISRELHDDLGQALTAVKIDLGMIRQQISDVEIISKIRKVSTLVSDTIKTVQRLTSQLRPDIIDDLGLEAAIEWYTSEFAQRVGVQVVLDMDSSITISPDVSLIVFRIMQESLTNIARHSRADRVDLALSRKGDQITLRISDNGIGITEQQLKAKDSFGLISMKERALSMGGIFAISSEPGKGTVINLIVPVTVKAVPFRAND